MILLDKKSYRLLSYLVELQEPETVMAISKKLNQSRRKIYYHLEKINEALPADVEKIISYPRVGILLSAQQRAVCQELLDELDDYSYVMSIEERLQLSLTYIAISKERVTIEKLMNLHDVSRNTILNDLNDIRRKLSNEEYDINLRVTKARGYYLECHPLSKVQYLYRLLYGIYTEGNRGFIAIVKEKILDLTEFGRYFSEEVNHYLHHKLSSAQERLGKKINPQDSQFMVQILPYLLLSYQSIDLTKEERDLVRSEFSLTWKRLEYVLAQEIAKELAEKFDLHLDMIEISLVAMLLLSFRKDRDVHLDSQDYAEMKLTLNEFLKSVQSNYGLSFNHYGNLLNQLLMHCKALIYRKTYGILSVNHLTNHIKDKYPELFEATQGSIQILERAWRIKMTESDIAYIAIHLGGELEHTGVSHHKKTATLVCDEGVGIQKLLLSQCRQCLPNYELNMFTSEQFDSISDILETDMVVTTSDGLETKFVTIVVHPILSINDMVRLLRFSKTSTSQSGSNFSQKLEKCLQAYVPDAKERYALSGKIEQLINQELMGE